MIDEGKVASARWHQAQSYERGYWDRRARQIESGGAQLGWYEWRAGKLLDRLKSVGLHDKLGSEISVLEVGSGPVGINSFFPGSVSVALDPLAQFYAKNPILSECRSPRVQYVAGMGEHLPFDDDRFDVLIIDNCIDHVQDVDLVMQNLRRVLRSGGILYLTVNVRTRPGTLLHRLLSKLRIDKGHPHSFDVPTVRKLVEEHSLHPLAMRCDSYLAALREDLFDSSWKARLKGVLGLSEFTLECIALCDEAGLPDA